MIGRAGQPGVPSWQIQPASSGLNQDVGCATATGLAPVGNSRTMFGNVNAPGVMPSVTTWFFVEPDSASAKNAVVEKGKMLSRPAGASKPDRSPTIESG